MRQRRAGRYALLAAPIAVLLLLTACQSGGVKGAKVNDPAGTDGPEPTAASADHQSDDGPTTGSSTVKISWKPRDVGGAQFAPIVTAYKSFITTTLTLEGTPDPSDSRIAEVATGAAQQYLVKVLTDLKDKHQARHGTVVMRPHIQAADPTGGTATITDCADFSHYFADKQTKPATGSTRRPIEATLSDANGGWQVTSFGQGEATACTGV